MPKSTQRTIREVYAAVDARDEHRCRRCGRVWLDDVADFSRHHRIPRGAGGSALVNRASNIVTLCGSGTYGCHGWAESNRDDAAILGYLLPKLNLAIDPEFEPIFVHEYGWVLLDDHGNIAPCSPPRREVP